MKQQIPLQKMEGEKSMLISRRSFLYLSASATLAAPIIVKSGKVFAKTALEKVSVRLDYTPWGIHAPFHLAISKGWFSDVGLAPEFDDGNGSVSTIQIVGNGQYDIGHASLGPMAIARGKGVQIKSTATIFGQNDIALIVDQNENVKTVSDLKGKTIAYTPGSLEAPFIDKFLAAGGLTRDDISLESVDASAKVGLYVNKRVDGIFSSPTFTLPQFGDKRPANVLRFADADLDFLGYGLFSTDNVIAERPEALGKFASVVAGTWDYILSGHEDEGVQAIIDARPQSRLDPKVLRGQIEELRKYVSLPNRTGSPTFAVTNEDWQATLNVLGEVDLVPKGAVASDYFTNSLLNAEIVAAVGRGERPNAGN